METNDAGTLMGRLFAAATVGLKVLHLADPDDPETWRYLHCNDTAASALGMTVDQIEGQLLLELFPAVRGTVVMDNYRRCLAERVPVPFGETSYTHSDGRTDWFRAHIVPLDDAHVGAIFQNINAERESKQALMKTQTELEHRVAMRTEDARRAQQRVQAIVDSAPDIILEIDPDGTIGLGARLTAVGVRTLQDLVGHENSGRLQQAIVEALETGRAQLTAHQPANGRQVLDIRLAPITGPETRLVAVVRDVTKLHRLERERQVRERMATLGTLAAGVGHEINTPLQYMGINLERLHEHIGGIDEDLRESVDEIAYGAARIREVIDELRHFVRGRPEARPELVDVQSMVDRTIALANHRLRKTSRVERDYADAPPIRVHTADLSQAVLNLLVNAADALEGTTGGVIQVSIGRDDDCVAIGVHDNGPGMDEATAARVFDPFWTDKSTGTGLGLGISKELVERNGGSLSVESEPGEGTTFWLRLPLPTSTPARRPRLGGSRSPSRVSREPAGDRSRPSLLVIDDEPLLCKALASTLEGFEVTTRGTLRGAREALGQRWFDVVLCDLFLGADRGDDLLFEIRAHDPEQAGRFVLMSGTVDPSLDHVDAPTLEKPFKVGKLARFLEEFLAEAEERRQRSG